jgi:hypothetical protein
MNLEPITVVIFSSFDATTIYSFLETKVACFTLTLIISNKKRMIYLPNSHLCDKKLKLVGCK